MDRWVDRSADGLVRSSYRRTVTQRCGKVRELERICEGGRIFGAIELGEEDRGRWRIDSEGKEAQWPRKRAVRKRPRAIRRNRLDPVSWWFG